MSKIEPAITRTVPESDSTSADPEARALDINLYATAVDAGDPPEKNSVGAFDLTAHGSETAFAGVRVGGGTQEHTKCRKQGSRKANGEVCHVACVLQ